MDGITRRGETTHSGVDANNTHPSMINPLNKLRVYGMHSQLHQFETMGCNYSFILELV